MAIVVAADEAEVRSIRRLAWATAFALATLLLILILASGPDFASLLGIESLGPWAALLPAALFLTAVQEAADYTAARDNRFRDLSLTTVLQALITNVARVASGLVAPVVGSLVTITTLGPGIHITLLRVIDRNPHRRREAVSLRTLIETARRHRAFALFRAPSDLLNSASQTIPVILLGISYGPAVAGLYALARSVLNVPSNLIGNAIGSVFYAHFAEARRAGTPLAPTATRATLTLLLGPGLAILAFVPFAPWVFGVTFGADWRESGHYAQWMALWIVAALANVPSVRLIPVIDRQRFHLLASLVMLSLRIGGLALGTSLGLGPISTIGIYSVVSAVCNIGLIVIVLSLTRRFDAKSSGPEQLGETNSAAE